MIAAVIGIGTIVVSVLLSLFNTTANTDILSVTQVVLVGTQQETVSSGSMSATITFTVQNTGSANILVPVGSLVSVSINPETASTTTSCSGSPTSYIDGAAVTWDAVAGGPVACNAAGTVTSMKWVMGSATTLDAGSQLTFSVTFSFSATSSSISNPITTGSQYILGISLGNAGTTQQITAK
ncbi:MAG: hypothetical protein JRN68_00245 [Nitrososphaerota archaeon]|nr:hypothetical protein [Ferrimicrobium acidiphilum]MDG6933108.1 hypothetical protein [Nitrososphaerota archaeon]